MNQDVIERAYESLSRARVLHYDETESLGDTKAIFEALKLHAVEDGRIVGGNADTREAAARKLFPDEYQGLLAAQMSEKAARLELELSQDMVEKVRLLMRAEEVEYRSEVAA